MLRPIAAVLSVAGLLALSAATAAAAVPPLTTPATHALIMDQDTGVVLFSKNGDEAMPPASMSKIMTILMVFERLDDGSLQLDDEFEVSVDAWERGGWKSGSSNMCLQPNVRVSVEDLIHGVVVLSGNDASIVLAQNISGSEEAFAADMTRRAEDLGIENATFANATGWPHPDHRMSARALAEMARITIRDHPELYKIYAEKEFGYCVDSPANRFNRNPVLGVIDGADGLKTGHTVESGYGLVASAVRDGKRRIVVFNGLTSNAERSREAERLLNAAFRDFEVDTPFAAGDVVATAPVAVGVTDEVGLVIQESITLGYHRRAARDVEAWVDYEGPLKAPVREGDKIGTFHLKVPGSPEVVRDVFAGGAVAKKGLIGRAQDGLVHLIRTGGADAG